jgi:hypothetical protein
MTWLILSVYLDIDIRGADIYKFPVVPELLAVWGCNNDTYPTINNATYDCPTSGKYRLLLCCLPCLVVVVVVV